MKREIIQIMPAPSWYAIFKHPQKEGKSLAPVPLVGWALVKDHTSVDWPPTTSVVGLTAGDSSVQFCDQIDNFDEYRYMPNY
jgi:hypothetical protein